MSVTQGSFQGPFPCHFSHPPQATAPIPIVSLTIFPPNSNICVVGKLCPLSSRMLDITMKEKQRVLATEIKHNIRTVLSPQLRSVTIT